MKTRLNPISAWSSIFQRKDCLFIGITHTRRILGRSGEQTLPLTPQPCRENAALAAFPRPRCGQVATPCWWVSLAFPSTFIFSWFSRLSSELWRNDLWFLALTDRFREDSSQLVFNLSNMPRFSPDSLILNLFWIKSGFGGLLGSFPFTLL